MKNKIRLYLLSLVKKDYSQNRSKYGVKKLETIFDAEKHLTQQLTKD